MSEPETTGEYMAALNASLEIGLRSRRRIFSEVGDHLGQAVQEQLDRGARPEEAQRRAIAAFGAPEEVAARFESGLVGGLDRRLALGARWVHRRTAERPAGFVLVGVVLVIFLGAAFAAVGAAFGRDPLLAAVSFLGAGTAWVPFAAAGQRFRDAAWSRYSTPQLFVLPGVYSCLSLLGGVEDLQSVWRLAGYITLVMGLLFLFAWVTESAVERAARRCAGSSERDRRQAWCAEHGWRAALSVVAPLALGSVALVAVHPGPIDLRVALVVLMVAMTALAAAAMRLEQARWEKDVYQGVFEGVG